MFYFNTTGDDFRLVYPDQQPPEPEVQFAPPQNVQQYVERLSIKRLEAEIGNIQAAAYTNMMAGNASKYSTYIALMAELRLLATAYQVDIEKTLFEGEPKFKFLLESSGVNGRDTVIEVINKIVLKLKQELSIN